MDALRERLDARSVEAESHPGEDHAGTVAHEDGDAEWQDQAEEMNIRRAGDDLIARALEKHGGNVKAAAAEVGVSERTIYRRLAAGKKQ